MQILEVGGLGVNVEQIVWYSVRPLSGPREMYLELWFTGVASPLRVDGERAKALIGHLRSGRNVSRLDPPDSV